MFNTIKIPKSSKKDINKLVKYVTKLVGNELGNISKACYMTKFIHYWRDILYLTGFKQDDINAFTKSYPKTSAFTKSQIFRDKYNQLILMCIIHFLNTKQYNNAKLFYYLLAIKNYSNLVHKHFSKFCSPELWRIAIDRVSNKHLFKVHNGIGNAILYLVGAEFDKKRKQFKKGVPDDDQPMYLFNLVMIMRHRISQSFKAFAQIYYKLADDGVRGGSMGDEYEQETTEIDIFTHVDKVTLSMAAYKQVDTRNIAKAVRFSGLQKEISTDIVTEFSKPQYREQIKFIYIIMNKIIPLMNICTERQRVRLIRKVNQNVKIGGYQSRDYIEKFLYSLDMDYSLKTIDKLQLIIFFCHYITLYARDRICR